MTTIQRNVQGRKWLALLVLVTFVFTSIVPTNIAWAENDSTYFRVADSATLDGWQEYFGANDTSFDTQYAGHVWTDKSVLTDASAFNYAKELADESGSISMTDNGDNFLVALSAMASSKSITGQDNKPTDTMIVLDLSSSMYNGSDRSTATVSAMINSVNLTIKQLQELNVNNRVGVTIYYGGVDRNQSTAPSYKLLLPLDRYVHSSNKFLRYTTSRGKLQTVGVNTNVKNENGKTVLESRTVTDVAGTYTQQGILSALQQFLKADTTVPETAAVNAGETRVPVMVLMSDGEPTAATHQYTNINADAGMGNNTVSIRYPDETDFVTQLTASYAKEMMDAHYEEDPLFYTLSLGTSISYDVMDPSDTLGKNFTPSSTISGYWDKLLANGSVGITVKNSPDGWRDPSVTKNYTVSKTTVTGKTLSSAEVFPSNKSQQLYVDKAFEAATASELANAFNNIFVDISLQTHTYPTLVEDDEELSGYVSFNDLIGEYMSVTDVKGVLLGNHWYSGQELAKNFVSGGGKLGTTANPTALGDEFVWSVQQRLAIDDVNVARNLLSRAYQNSQLSYDSATGAFSNYIGWYSDTNGSYLGFWQDGVTDAPANAVYVNKSYLYLGETDESHGVSESDMMYTIVRVRTEIETGVQMVSFAVPAALIPTVEFDIEYDEKDELSSVTRGGADNPIRLVYEVELDDSINEHTMVDVVDSSYIANNTDEDGYVNFYTNQWEVDRTVGYGKVNTYSYFRPSHQNENYYYQENETVYINPYGDKYISGNEPNPKGEYYREITVYSKEGNTIKEENIYRQLSSEALETAVSKGDGTWYIRKGNVHVNMDGYIIAKSDNLTGTLEYVNYSYVDVKNHHVNDTNHSFVVGDTLGNNGKVRIKAETGIKLTKVIEQADPATNMNEEFEFTIITIANETAQTVAKGAHDAVKIAADGTETATTITFDNEGKATATLKHGESLYILGLTAGLGFTITETEEADFAVSKVVMDDVAIPETVASGAVGDGQIVDVVFTNVPRGKGALTIAKLIEYPAGTENVQNRVFDIKVTFEGAAVKAGDIFETAHTGDVTHTNVTLDANKSFELQLKHGESVEIFGIPEGTKAIVTETDPGTGFTASYKVNNILVTNDDGSNANSAVVNVVKAPTIDTVTVVNQYQPEPVEIKIDLKGKKTLLDDADNIIAKENWGDLEFKFIIQKYVYKDGKWQWVDTEEIVTANKTNDVIDFVDGGKTLSFTEVGTYGYQVIEQNHGLTIEGITYDATMHTFDVVVTDVDMDGKLEAKVVSSHGDVNNFKFTNGTWVNDQINFTNANNQGHTSRLIMIKKALENESGSTNVSLEGYQFELYESNEDYTLTGNLVKTTDATDASGETYISLEYDYTQAGTYTYYYKLKEKNTAISGMTYSDKVYNFKIDVTAYNDGSMSSEITADANTQFDTFVSAVPGVTYKLANFTNKYNPVDAEVILNVKKVLDNRTLAAGEFTFLLKQGDNVLQEKTNDVSGNVAFDKLTFDKVGSYYYTVEEILGTDSHITYDETVYDVVVEVKDNNGKLSGNVIVREVPGSEMVFTNVYTPDPVSIDIGGTKILENKILQNNQFTFVLAESDSEGNVKANGVTKTAKNSESGAFVFEPLTYQPEMLSYSQPSTFYYVVYEDGLATRTDGITYDSKKYLVTVTVKYDPDKGKFSAAKSIAELGGAKADAIAFTNSYTMDPTSITITGNKILNGRELTAGQFTFDLYASDANWQKGNKLGSQTNSKIDASTGAFSFTVGEFTAPGTYYYIVEEVIPDPVPGGYDYDDKKVGVIVSVTDDLKGKLVASARYVNLYQNDDDTVNTSATSGVSFVNSYTIKEAGVANIIGKKILNGGSLSEFDNAFSFALKAADGSVIEIVTADSNGNFAFTALSYTVAGTYTYTVSEVIPENKIAGVTYDATEYTVTVTAVDNGDGTMSTNVAYSKDSSAVNGVEFTNKYEISIPVQKVWDDVNNHDNIRPAQIVVNLFKQVSPEATPTLETTATLTANNGWTHTFTNLPEYDESGNKITYSVFEEPVNDYTTAITGDQETGFTITNTHIPVVSVSGVKVWNDSNNQDGKRPNSITIHLLANDEFYWDTEQTNKVGTVQLSCGADGVWDTDELKFEFKDLPKYMGDKEVVYLIVEEQIENYERHIQKESDGTYTITNERNPDKTEIHIEKTWRDNDNQDGIRPDSITVKLLADGVETDKTLTLNANNNWRGHFDNLDKNQNGVAIQYTVQEEAVTGYEEPVIDDKSIPGVVQIVNKHIPAETSATVVKVWNDANDQDGKRPEELIVTLSNGTATVATVTLNEANNWTEKVENLPKYANGTEINYTWTEDANGLSNGYTLTDTSVNGTITTLTNSYTPETTEATVEKIWDDFNNQDGRRPDELTVALSNGTETVGSVTLNEENGWTATVKNLPKYANGELIDYTWIEGSMPAGYTLTDTSIDETVTTLTNSYTPEKTSVSGKKTWNDANDQDGKRPQNITVNLLANNVKVDSKVVTSNAVGEWTYAFTNLNKYQNGEVITYTIAEDPVPGYTTVISGYDITNSYTPQNVKVVVNKTWVVPQDDKNNSVSLPAQTGENGETPVTVTLLKDNQTADASVTNEPIKVLKWTDNQRPVNIDATTGEKTFTSEQIVWENLPMYENGTRIIWDIAENLGDYADEYTIHEDVTEDTHTITINLTNIYDLTHRSLLVNKVWEDSNNQDGSRPASIDVQLLYSVDNGASWNEVPNNDTPTTTPDETILSDSTITGFFSTVDGVIQLTPSHARASALEWGYIWDNLPQYHNNDQDGTAISYKVQEVSVPDGYYGYDNSGQRVNAGESLEGIPMTTGGWAFKIINYHDVDTRSVTVHKVWNDAGNRDGKRPESVGVQLYRNGTPYSNDTVTLNDANQWTYTWSNLPKHYNNGQLIQWTVRELYNGREVRPGGSIENAYVVSYQNNTVGSNAPVELQITNSYTPDITSISGTKYWNDNNNETGVRPESITVKLFADGQWIDEQVVTSANNWQYYFDGLPKYENGEKIDYTVEETISAVLAEHYDKERIQYVMSDNGFDIINTLAQKYFDIFGEKHWADAEGNTIVAPDGQVAEIVLFRDNVEVDRTTASALNGWKYSFTDLERYALDGTSTDEGYAHLYEYRIEETPVDGYTPFYDVDVFADGDVEVIITNTFGDKQFVSVSGTKIWNDSNNALNIRPSAITVALLKDGEQIDAVQVSADTNWAYSFEQLERYSIEGAEIKYTIQELNIPEGYISTVIATDVGYDIVNTVYQVDAGTITVSKTVAGDNAPAKNVPFHFTLKVKSTIKDWDAVMVYKKLLLDAAWEDAVDKRNKAQAKVDEAERLFENNAAEITTNSAYRFIMSKETTESVYSFKAVDKYGNVVTTGVTGSSYDFMWKHDKVAADKETGIVQRVINAIKVLADWFSNLGSDATFLKALHSEVSTPSAIGYSSTPAAIGFYKDDAERLFEAQRDLLDAEALIQTTTEAALKFVEEHVTTPTAIKLVLTPVGENSNLNTLEFRLDQSDVTDDGYYEVPFELFAGTTYKVDIEATTGAEITYSIVENLSAETSKDYKGTDVHVNGTLVSSDSLVRQTGTQELNDYGVNVVFHNIYENDDPYVPPYIPPYIPDEPEDEPKEDPEEPKEEPKNEPEDPKEDPEDPVIPGTVIPNEPVDTPEGAVPTGDTNHPMPYVVMLLVGFFGMLFTRKRTMK